MDTSPSEYQEAQSRRNENEELAELAPQAPFKLPAVPAMAGKLRVAIVSDAIDGRNGVGTYYPDLVQHLEHQVDDLLLIAPKDELDPNLERLSLPMPGDSTQRMSWPRMRALFKKLDDFAPNVVVIPSLGAFSYYAMKYSRRRDVAFAIVNHTNFDHLLALYWPKWMVAPFRWGLRNLNAFLCREASGVAAMNADAFQMASHAGSAFTRVMGTPLAFDFLCTARTPVDPEIRRAIFVGRLAEEKGISQILDAAEKLPHIEFVIAGDGPLRKEVESRASKHSNLKYLGWLSRNRVKDEIDASQVLMLPSIFETFGTVALEALARQRYVIASRDCGIVKWPSFANGIFCIEQNETLADAMRRLSQSPHQKRLDLAQVGWDSVEVFNDHTIRTWLKFLCDTLQRRVAKRLGHCEPAEDFDYECHTS